MYHHKNVTISNLELAINEHSYGKDDPYRYMFSATVTSAYKSKQVRGYGKTPSEAMDNALSMRTDREEEARYNED